MVDYSKKVTIEAVIILLYAAISLSFPQVQFIF